MSFAAHGPEQVYRYVLRLDKRERSLSDRFGFSIVLLNDDSDVCTRFLLEYFAKLSHRTAHRVRFVFFAEMTEAEASNRRMSSNGHLTPEWYRRFFRGPRWDELRPEALELVTRPQELLDQWIEKSAIPDNTGGASRFAERVGVAGYIPCLLMFKDVGDRTVHVMPLGGLTDASEVFEQVCHWVDEFYSDNREALARWDEAEERIRALCSQVRTTLETLDKWRRSTLERGREMRELAIAIRGLEELKHARRESWHTLSSSPPAGLQTRAVRERLADVCEALQTLTEFHRLEQTALSGADDLRSATDAAAIARAIEHLMVSGVLDGDGRARIESPLESLRVETAAVQSMDPNHQLAVWRAGVPRWPSRDEYVSCTAEWAKRHPGPREHDEYGFLVSKLLGLSVATQPDAGAQAVVEAYAARFAADDPNGWPECRGPLQQLLQRYLQGVVGSAPGWLAATPEIRIGDALKGYHTADAIIRETDLRADDRAAAAERLLDHARALKEQALTAVAAVLPLYETRPEHLQILIDRHLPPLRDARTALEEDLRGSLQTTRGWWTTPIDAEQVRQITAVLDEYDAAVASLSFPYERDPLVIEVPTLLSGFAATVNAYADGPQDTRSRFASAIEAQEQGAHAFDSGLRELEGLIPLSALERALSEVVSSQRREQLLLGRSTPRDVLGRLTSGELAAVCSRLRVPFSGDGNVLDTMARVLSTIGADPGSGNAVSSGHHDHDVFLSYQNGHRPIIERIADILRELGLRPWLDTAEIAPGDEFKVAILRALSRCRACAVFVGPEGIGRWQRIELDAAYESAKRGLRMIPVLLGSADRRQLPVILRRFSFVQISDAADRAAIEKLGRGLRGAATVDVREA